MGSKRVLKEAERWCSEREVITVENRKYEVTVDQPPLPTHDAELGSETFTR